MTKSQAAMLGVGGVLVLAWLTRPKGTVTTSEEYDLSPYGGPTNYSPKVRAFADAIARAEGFYVAGSVPQRARNPGDLKIPNWTGPVLGEGISVFESVDQGWNALYRQLQFIIDGRSRVYNLDFTIRDMGRKYTATLTEQDAWANNVARVLNVPVDTPLWQVLV